MMLALCAAVTLRRPFSRAYSKAARTIRSEPNTEIGLIEMPECSRICEPSSSGDELAQLLGLLGVLLELDARVEVLGVLAHDHDVGLGEPGAHALVGLAGPDAGVQVELLAQQHVDRAEAGADRRRGRALDADPVRLIDSSVRSGNGLPSSLVDVLAGGLLVPLELDAGRLEHPAGGLGQLGPGAVAGDEGDSVSGHRGADY